MTFNFIKAASLPFLLPYNPDPVPGWTWTPPGFWLNFADPSQIDDAHSLNYIACERGMSIVSPSRKQGATILGELFTGGLGAYTFAITGSGSAHIATSADGFPGLVGKALVLSTNGTLGSIAGIERVLGTIPASFSYAAEFNTVAVGSNPLDALHVWVQNNVGVTLQTRFYNGVCETFADGAWRNIGTIGGLGIISEGWVLCIDNGNGTHTVKLYGGCQLYGSYTGVLATGVITNNATYVSQQSGANANRVSILDVLNIGPTQLADDMAACSPMFSAQTSATNGHVQLLYENVSRDIVLGSNLHAFVTKENIGSWVEVPLTDQGVVGKGELDVTADVHLVTGDVAFPGGSGTSMRAYVASNSGVFPVLQGLTMFWD